MTKAQFEAGLVFVLDGDNAASGTIDTVGYDDPDTTTAFDLTITC